MPGICITLFIVYMNALYVQAIFYIYNMERRKILLVFLLFLSFTVFAQSKKPIHKDTSRRSIDSVIAKYEAEGLKYYKDSMYYAAIYQYTVASNLLDSLFNAKHRFLDARDYTITMCNIATCHYKMNCFSHAQKFLGDVEEKWIGDGPFDYHKYGWKTQIDGPRLYAYTGFCFGDYHLAMRQFSYALGSFCGCISELYKTGQFPRNGILTYPYAINSYSYKIAYAELGDYLKTHGDTANATIYYRKSTSLDSVLNDFSPNKHIASDGTDK